MSQCTLQEIAVQSFESRLQYECKTRGIPLSLVQCGSNTILHDTVNGTMAYNANSYHLEHKVTSLSCINRCLEVNEGIHSSLNQMINSMILNIMLQIYDSNQGEGVAVYFTPKDINKERIAECLYTDLILCKDNSEIYPAIAIKSFFLVAPIGQPLY